MYTATARSRAGLRSIASAIRKFVPLPHFPVLHALEHWLPILAPGWTWDIVEAGSLDGDNGRANFIRKVILIPEDIYSAAARGDGSPRMIVAHEIAHAMIHSPSTLAHTHRLPGAVPAYADPEWQAKALAGELMFFHEHASMFDGPDAAAIACGISRQAARYQWQCYQREGLVDMRAPLRKNRRPH